MTLLKRGKPSRGRNVARVFAHMHEVRGSILERSYDRAPELPRFEGSEAPDADRLEEAFRRSGEAVSSVFRIVVEGDAELKGWKTSPAAWLMYPGVPRIPPSGPDRPGSQTVGREAAAGGVVRSLDALARLPLS